MQLEKDRVSELRKSPLVAQWIRDYQKNKLGKKNPECSECGWPHSPVVMCGWGATFGQLRLGEQTHYVHAGDIEYIVSLVTKHRASPGISIGNDIYFETRGADVVVRRIEYFNSFPSAKEWTIPAAKWRSIVEAVGT